MSDDKAIEVLNKQIEVLRETVSKEQTKVMTAQLKATEAEQKAESIRVRTLQEVIDKVEEWKGIAGKLSMAEWSQKLIPLLQKLINKEEDE